MAITAEHLSRAFISTRALLDAVQPDQLGAPTPCASWDVRGLINHFVGSALWGAAAIAGDDLAEEDFVAGDFRARYDESMHAALAAFGSAGALETTVLLPFGEVTGADMMGIVTGDQFTHGWDLARAIGYPTDLDPELAEALLVMAKGFTRSPVVRTARRPSGPSAHRLREPFRPTGSPRSWVARRDSQYLEQEMDVTQATAARDSATFVNDTEPFRRELLARCYRLLGSPHDAEDLVQETYLRAARAYGDFEGRSSVRTWLYRIATNACLSALTHRSRRVLPSGLGGPEPDPGNPSVRAPADVVWLQPVPDRLVSPESADPAAVVAGSEGLRLALIASLQYLPGRQRAVLILRDVLAFPATEVAAMLDTSTAAVTSTLQRARARLAELGLVAFEAADATALGRLLCRDAALEATPFLNWFAGKKTCVPFLHLWVLGSAGDWRMRPTSANGQPAAACYARDAHGVYQGYGIVVLTATHEGISRIVSFGDAGLLSVFGFPPVWSE